MATAKGGGQIGQKIPCNQGCAEMVPPWIDGLSTGNRLRKCDFHISGVGVGAGGGELSMFLS